MPEEPQEEVIAFLSRPQSYGADVTKVERDETQISIVFLAGQRAYKLLRAVKLSFLDFTPTEARRHGCEAGLALNRRMAPDIYLDCLPVTREADGSLALGGRGEAVDYVLEMQRFNAACRFDRLLDAGALTGRLIERLAEEIHTFHKAELPVVEGAAGGPIALRRVLENNILEIERYPRLFAPEQAKAVHCRLREALADVAPLLAKRKAEEWVRHCHGDLHLRNIVLWKGRPTLFDCLEFDPEMATIDLLYDLAFLIMDLDARDRRDLANLVLGRALLLSGGYGGLAALPLFLALRSHIRAFVAAGAAGVAGETEKRRRLQSEAQAYFERTVAYLTPPAPRLVVLGGLSGSGKSTLGRLLAPGIGAAPGALHLRSDVLRKHLAGVGETERLPASAYSQASSERVYGELRKRAKQALVAGHSVLIDAVHARAAEREAAENLAKQAGVAFSGLWLEVPGETLISRVAGRHGDASDATAAVVERQLGRDLGQIAWKRLEARGDLEETAAKARKILTA